MDDRTGRCASDAEPVVLCWSGGKDSALALYDLNQQPQYEVAGLVTTVTAGYDRISMHGVRTELLCRQAEAIGLPLEQVEIPPQATNVEYEAAMSAAFERCRERGITTVAFGDIFLVDLREYRERQLAALGMRCLFPVWGAETAELARRFIGLGFQAVTVCIDPRCLDASFAGRLIDEAFLRDLPPGADPCGENGEFHTFVFDGPIFDRPVPLSRGETVLRDSFLFCDFVSGPASQTTERRTADRPASC